MSMKGFTRKGLGVGMRVQVPAWSDIWMRGARFGVVVATGPNDRVKVRMDHPQVKRLHTFNAADCDVTK